MLKSVLAVIILLQICCGIAVHGTLNGCSGLPCKKSSSSAPRKSSRIFPLPKYDRKKLRKGKKQFKLTILHTSDIHSHYEEFNAAGLSCSDTDKLRGNCYGGYARLKTAIQTAKMQDHPVYVVDAGDQFQGTIFYNTYRGEKLPYIIQELGYDVVTLGNHEFDDSLDDLAQFVRQCPVPVVNCNLDFYDGALAPYELYKTVKPYVILEHGVAFIGSLTPTVVDLAMAANGVIIGSVVATIQNQVNELHRRGINRIVVLSHNGINDDLQIARLLSGVSVIIGGHSHTFLSNTDACAAGPYPIETTDADGQSIRIVHSGCWGKYLGRFTLTWNADGLVTMFEGEPILLDQSIQENDVLKAKISEWKRPVVDMLKQKLGYSNIDMPYEECLIGECVLGNLYALILYEDVRRRLGPGSVDFGFINTKGIRAGITRGDITFDTLFAVMPFENAITRVALTGAQIVEMLENIGNRINKRSMQPIDSNVQIHNLRYVYSSANPGHLCSCYVFDAHANNFVPVVMDKVYYGATSSFLSYGGDNMIYPAQADAQSFTVIRDAFREWLQLNTGPIQLSVDGRIKSLDDSMSFCD